MGWSNCITKGGEVMCQAYEAEHRYVAQQDLAKAKAVLEKLIARSESGDEPTKQEWSTAMAIYIMEREA